MSSSPLNLVIRFTTSLHDLHLNVDHPHETTIIAIKQQIRAALDSSISQNRLRLIHSGKLLRDTDILPSILSPAIPPPPRSEPKGKGKLPLSDETSSLPIYINCAIGDVLSPAELESEALLALQPSYTKSTNSPLNPTSPQSTEQIRTTSAPRGFDRLLSSGFTQPEITQLRFQFLSIQSSIHTEDDMPSPSTLRRMEDAWIDSNASSLASENAAEEFDFGEEGGSGGALDDFLWGNVMGFLWPLGCVGWAMRENGVWSPRRSIAVFTGFVLSLTFGMLRVVA